MTEMLSLLRRLLMVAVVALVAFVTAAYLVHGAIKESGRAGIRVGPAFSDSFTITCGSSATQIIPPSGLNQISYTCQTPAAAETGGTTLVAVGDSGIADPAIGTRNSPVYSGDTIREWGGNVRTEYCRADTGTVTIFCRAMVATSTAP